MLNKSNVLLSATALGSMGLVNAQAQFDWNKLQSYAFNALVSKNCQDAIKNTFSSQSELGQCQFIDQLVGIQDQPSLDNYLSKVCSASPCSDNSLRKASNDIWQACSTELGYVGISQDYVNEAFNSYSVQREVACLTRKDYAQEPYCLSLLYQDLESLNLFSGNAQYQNMTHEQFQTLAEPVLCNDCVAASLDLIQFQYPELQSLILDQATGTTLGGWFEGLCSKEHLKLTTDGSYPQTVGRTANGSNFPHAIYVTQRSLRRNIGTLKNRFFNMA